MISENPQSLVSALILSDMMNGKSLSTNKFKELFEKRAVDVAMPDIGRVGGLMETKNICALAETYGIPVKDVAKLGSAENPFGPSKKAVQAVSASLSQMDIYPNWTAEPLREKITEKYGIHGYCYSN